MPACPQCRSELAAGAPHCPRCGARFAPPASGGPRPQVTLRIVRADGGPEVAFLLKKDEAFAGGACEIPLLDDPFVAARQVRFFFAGAAPAVEDVGGGNGVYVRIRAEQRVRPGQEFRCGRQRLVLEPLPAAAPGTPKLWGSPDPGYRYRVVQLLEGGRRGDAFPLKDGENPLGREAGDITFPGDGFVSGRHAVVTVRGDAISLRDVGSSNGTFLRLDAPQRVERGDQLLVGKHLIKIEA